MNPYPDPFYVPILRLIDDKDYVAIAAVECAIVFLFNRNDFKFLDPPYFDPCSIYTMGK